MPRLSRFLIQLSALAILVASGIVHGLWSGRWAGSDVFREQVAALGRVPTTIGDWEGQELELDRRVIDLAGIAGYRMRRYVNRRDGAVVTALLICGRPGPISVHTPEVCYAGAGYEPQASTGKLSVELPGGPRHHELWVADFTKTGSIAPEYLRVIYGWSLGGVWVASEHPRLDFGGHPALYKLYVVHETKEVGDPPQAGPGAAFVRQLLPLLRDALVARP